MLDRTKCLLLSFGLLGSLNLTAQTLATSNPYAGKDNNPYSRYGIGELVNGNNVVLRGMGNITSAYANPYAVNSDNPASYSALKRTTFEAAAFANTRSLTDGTDKFSSGTASLAYINLGFPIGNRAGMAFGYRPVSQSFYQLSDTIAFTPSPATPIGTAMRFFGGDGHLNLPYIGAAYDYKGLSIGANIGYLFGTIRNTSALVPLGDSLRAYTSEFTRINKIGGIYWKGGISYARTFDSSMTFRIGGTLTLNQDITQRLNEYHISRFIFTNDTTVNDTVYNPGENRGKLTLPMSYSVGILLARADKWGIGVDYSASQWSQFRSYPDSALTTGVGNNSFRISLGGEYTPDINSIRGYFSRVTYRLGAYYGKDYVRVNNADVPYYGLTAGASFPFRRTISRIHTSLDVGRMGTTANNVLQQTYVRFSIGLSFNDVWFIKRRYD